MAATPFSSEKTSPPKIIKRMQQFFAKDFEVIFRVCRLIQNPATRRTAI